VWWVWRVASSLVVAYYFYYYLYYFIDDVTATTTIPHQGIKKKCHICLWLYFKRNKIKSLLVTKNN